MSNAVDGLGGVRAVLHSAFREGGSKSRWRLCKWKRGIAGQRCDVLMMCAPCRTIKISEWQLFVSGQLTLRYLPPSMCGSSQYFSKYNLQSQPGAWKAKVSNGLSKESDVMNAPSRTQRLLNFDVRADIWHLHIGKECVSQRGKKQNLVSSCTNSFEWILKPFKKIGGKQQWGGIIFCDYIR